MKRCSRKSCRATKNLLKHSNAIYKGRKRQYYYCRSCNAENKKKNYNTTMGKVAQLRANRKYRKTEKGRAMILRYRLKRKKLNKL